jgi:hypothetical protein
VLAGLAESHGPFGKFCGGGGKMAAALLAELILGGILRVRLPSRGPVPAQHGLGALITDDRPCRHGPFGIKKIFLPNDQWFFFLRSGDTRNQGHYHRVMAHPAHQKYWFMVTGGSGLLGIAMITAAATVGGSSGRLDATGPLAILAYIAFGCMAVFFVCGIRQLRFPFAKTVPASEGEAPPPPPSPPSPWRHVDEDLKELDEWRRKQEDSDN